MDAYEHRLAISRRFGERIASGDAVFMTGNGLVLGAPCTVVDGVTRGLTGVNRLMVQQVMRDVGWTDPRFFTLAQIQQEGWSLRVNAKRIGLQYLVSADGDGIAPAQPTTKQFSVFNAADIEGIPPMVRLAMPTMEDIRKATESAGINPHSTGVREAVDQMLAASPLLDPYRSVAGAVALRTRIAACLLEAQMELPRAPLQDRALTQHWRQAINNEPLSLFYAIKDAEVLATEIAQEVTHAQLQRKTTSATMEQPTSSGRGKSDGNGSGKARSGSASPELQAQFEARTAVLAVPFADKDRVKQLGGMYYAPQKLWFVPQGVDMQRFKEWTTNGHSLGSAASTKDILDDFRKAMNLMGFDPKAEIKDDGKWHNIGVDSKKGKNLSGAYLLDLSGGEDGTPRGVLNNKHTGEHVVWKYEGSSLTPEQRAHFRALAREREAMAQLEIQKAHDLAASHAKEIFAAGVSAAGHGYVLKKGIPAEGLRMAQGSVLLQHDEFYGESGATMIRPDDWYLLVPMSNEAGELRAVQAINADGSVKSFMRGAQKQGTMLVLGAQSFAALLQQPGISAIAWTEGVATGASFRAATGIPTVVSFDAGNLETVALQTIAHLPASSLKVLAVDNDQFHVERAVGMVARDLGINPYGRAGGRVAVWDGAALRPVSLGDAIADGEWHQTAKGKYCLTLTKEEGGEAVRSIHLEMVPDAPGRKVTATFGNRGVEAGRTVVEELEKRGLATNNVAVAIPTFRTLAGRPTDWNDLAQTEGLGAVRGALSSQGLAFLGQQPLAQRGAPEQVERHSPQHAALSR